MLISKKGNSIKNGQELYKIWQKWSKNAIKYQNLEHCLKWAPFYIQ